MDLKEQVKSLLREAGLYQSQGLLNEAQELYEKTDKLVEENEVLKQNKNLVDFISKKADSLKDEMEKVEEAPSAPEMSAKIQDVILDKFAFSSDNDAAALEGAIALVKFGQFGRALEELKKLTENESLRVVAGKHIIWCHMARTSIDDAVTQYQEWASGDLFQPVQLNRLRFFLQDILDKEGIDKTLPPVEEPAGIEASETPKDTVDEKEFPPISSIEIVLGDGPKKGESFEFDVRSQSGDRISFLVSADNKELLEQLETGVRVDEIRCYSPVAVFDGAGIISSNIQIESGPKRGNYSLEITIE